MNSSDGQRVYRVPPPGELAEPVYSQEELAAMAQDRERRTAMKAARARRKDVARRRWTMINCFVDEGMAGLKPADTAVWVALFRHARADGLVRLSRARLVSVTGLSPQTVKVSLSRLVSAGWLQRMQSGGPSGGIAVYCVKINKEGGLKNVP
ncbi:MAG: helix-turn-helix domain-containing protein [Candidatus Hydrogenedens sp.]|nr:helix-turn-helix domain-containing protein [Candidatus Hydrogenedens sp.]